MNGKAGNVALEVGGERDLRLHFVAEDHGLQLKNVVMIMCQLAFRPRGLQIQILAVLLDGNCAVSGILIVAGIVRERMRRHGIEVHKRHKSKHALSCLAYLSTITNIATDEPIEVFSIELRWVGFEDYSVVILANRNREFDASFILHGDEHIYLNTRKTTTTNPRYMMPVLEKGIYKLEYLVAAGNFGLAN